MILSLKRKVSVTRQATISSQQNNRCSIDWKPDWNLYPLFFEAQFLSSNRNGGFFRLSVSQEIISLDNIEGICFWSTMRESLHKSLGANTTNHSEQIPQITRRYVVFSKGITWNIDMKTERIPKSKTRRCKTYWRISARFGGLCWGDGRRPLLL